MRSLLLVVGLLCCSSVFAALENKFSLGGGVHANFVETDLDLGDSVNEEVSGTLIFGTKATIKLSDYWGLRTGAFIQEKAAGYEIKASGLKGEIHIKVISAAVPVNLQYQFNDNFAVFGGYSADFKINDYCTVDGDFDTCSLEKEAKSFVSNAILGMSIIPAKLWDIDISYQQGLSEFFYKSKVHTLSFMAFYNFQ
ncbi:outer membrane beta-barrel protein [Peredibacter starrii]|uniref:Outer membrane beta-barrel protein n=1 Tax=Peredibacter starrii TaxID=28202 RepID=A0AAX4HLD4_9BACT|nr:outer membrane beta-barrel protein [Peredibacter starrii]WPU64069.1 outer membrane beta-barrel protein [Peredibacter starrii]